LRGHDHEPAGAGGERRALPGAGPASRARERGGRDAGRPAVAPAVVATGADGAERAPAGRRPPTRRHAGPEARATQTSSVSVVASYFAIRSSSRASSLGR